MQLVGVTWNTQVIWITISQSQMGLPDLIDVKSYMTKIVNLNLLVLGKGKGIIIFTLDSLIYVK